MEICREGQKNNQSGNATTKELLRSYLHNAVVLTKGKSKAEAKRLLNEYYEKTDKESLLNASDALKVVKAKEKELKEKAGTASLKTKLNYASDADVASLSDAMAFGVAGVASSMLAPIVATDVNLLSGTMLTAAAAYTATKGVKLLAAEISESKTPEQAREAGNYARVKHAQFALKRLKKEIEAPIKAAEKEKRRKEIAQLFAAGYALPAGGLSAVVMSKQRAGR